MFEINLTIVIFAVSFLVFMSLLNEVFLKPVGEVIEKRQALIQGEHDAGKQYRTEAQLKLENYEKRLAGMREEAQQIISDAVNEAQARRNERISALKDNTRRRLEAEKEKLNQETPALLEGLISLEVALVDQIVTKLLGDSRGVEFSPDRVKRALEEAI